MVIIFAVWFGVLCHKRSVGCSVLVIVNAGSGCNVWKMSWMIILSLRGSFECSFFRQLCVVLVAIRDSWNEIMNEQWFKETVTVVVWRDSDSRGPTSREKISLQKTLKNITELCWNRIVHTGTVLYYRKEKRNCLQRYRSVHKIQDRPQRYRIVHKDTNPSTR